MEQTTEENKSLKHIYVAIDSDILRLLTFANKLLIKNPDIDLRKATNDINLQRFGGYIKTVLNSAKKDEIRLLIVNTVYQESCHSKSLTTFMKENCYFPKTNILTHKRYADEVERIAKLYTKPYSFREEIHPAPMKEVYIASLQKFAPTNDTYIMAEATIENSILLTANEKDFIKNNKNSERNHDRTFGIIAINLQNGYYERGEQYAHVAPKPIPLQILGPILEKNPENLVAPKSISQSKIKGEEFFRSL